MMSRPQNAPKGLFTKKQINVGTQELTYNSTHLILSGGIKLGGAAGGAITANSTGATFAGAVTLGAGLTLNGSLNLGGTVNGSNSTTNSIITSATAALPGNVQGVVGLTVLQNSTGIAYLVNTTGTTWKYLNVTTAQPT